MVLATVACVQRSPISFSARGKGNVPFPRVPFSMCNKGNRRCLQPQPQAIFEQNIGLEHVLSMKKSTISKETSIYGKFLNVKRGLSLLVNI